MSLNFVPRVRRPSLTSTVTAPTFLSLFPEIFPFIGFLFKLLKLDVLPLKSLDYFYDTIKRLKDQRSTDDSVSTSHWTCETVSVVELSGVSYNPMNDIIV